MSDAAPTKAIRPRPVRLFVSGVTARLGEDTGDLVNVSLGGALIKLACPRIVGAQERVVLHKKPAIIILRATVVRSTRDTEQPGGTDRWLVALQFTDLPDVLRPLISQLLQPTLTHDLTRWSPVQPAAERLSAERSPDPKPLHLMR